MNNNAQILQNINDFRWCKRHANAPWRKNSQGVWFERCVAGKNFNEECEIGKDEEVKDNG